MGKGQSGKHKKQAIPPIQLTPDQQDVINRCFNQATQLHQQGDLVQAEVLYKEILAIYPNHADAYHRLGAIAQQIGEWDVSVTLIKQAISINSQVAAFHYNLGLSLQQLNQLEASVAAYQKAIRLQPDFREAYENLSSALRDLNKVDDAIQACKRALEINPNALVANQNMGALLNTIGERNTALTHIDKVLNISPAYAEAHWVRALATLSLGHYHDGWQAYEWRFFSKSFNREHLPRTVPFPKWEGCDLNGKSILIHPEQGVGDEILFASCFNDVISQAQQCYIECDPRLVNLFSRSFPQATILAADRAQDFVWDKRLPKFDYRIPAGSLPRFFRQQRSDFPERQAYLHADADLIAQWKERLAALPHPVNIGISWCGGKDEKQKYTRSIPLQQWKKILKHEGLNFINLQYGDHEKEIHAINQVKGVKLHQFNDLDPLTDLDNFSALISSLDLVISIDNSTVHFSGALGIPTWVILPPGAAWTWQLDREDCDWYSTVKLFRQKRVDHGNWAKALEQVNSALSKHRFDTPSLREQCTQPSNNIFKLTPEAGLKTAVLLNDTTAWYHWGCSCTSVAIHQTLRDSYERVIPIPIYKTNHLNGLPDTLEEFDNEQCFQLFTSYHPQLVNTLRNADALYINGEGTLHGMSPQAIGLLYLAYAGKLFLNKPVYLINHSCYPEDSTVVRESIAYQLYKKVYKQLDYVAIRESVSHALLKEMKIEAQQSFDCLPRYIQNNLDSRPDVNNKQIAIGGSVAWPASTIQQVAAFARKMADNGYEITLLVGANAFFASDDVKFCEVFTQFFGVDIQIKLATSERDWLNTIASAQMLVSGRFHHSIAAAFLATPFIVLNSNTPKIKGLEQMLAMDCHIDANTPKLTDQLLERTLTSIQSSDTHTLTKEQRNVLYNLIARNFPG